MSSNYLPEIEDEFSKGRGKPSRLSPMDWNLAQDWENAGIPLHIVLGAMGDGFKKYNSQPRRDSVSSLKYFIPAVEKSFAEWQTSQVGKPIAENTPVTAVAAPAKSQFIAPPKQNDMQNSALAAIYNDENIAILDKIVVDLSTCDALPEPICSTVAVVKGEILALLDNVRQNRLCADKIDARLAELRAAVEVALIASVSDDERVRIIADNQKEYGKFHLMPGVAQKVLIRKLYNRFDLPKITLYAF